MGRPLSCPVSRDPASLSLRLYPDPVLRAKAVAIEEVDDTIRALADRMLVMMRESEGIGLAGPQVGLNLRIFVADVPADPDEPAPTADGSNGPAHPTSTNGPEIYINPEIEFIERQVSPFNEGCLSLPDIRGDVLRPDTVKIKALDIKGKPFERVGSGLLARCWQHEVDHLEGVLIIDKMNPVHLRQNSRKLREMSRSF